MKFATVKIPPSKNDQIDNPKMDNRQLTCAEASYQGNHSENQGSKPERLQKFYFLFFCFLALSNGQAQAAVGSSTWDCEQTPEGEWNCLNQDNPAPEPARPQTAKQPAAANLEPAAPGKQPATAPVKPNTAPPDKAAASPNPPPAQGLTPLGAAETAAEPARTKSNSVKSKVLITESGNKAKVERVEASRQSAAGQASEPGCRDAKGQASKNCNQSPPPPSDEELAAGLESYASWLTPTFNQHQEIMFQRLRDEFSRDPWTNCSNWSVKKRKRFNVSQQARETADTLVTADFSEAFEGEVMNYAGNVDLRRADQHLLADKASYDNNLGAMDAQGNIIYSEAAFALAADNLSLNLRTDEGKLRNTLYIAGDGPLRGYSEVVYRDSKILTRYHNTQFTSCAPGNQDWLIHAERLKINRESGKGSAKNAWLEFKGVPVAYTPYISFPTDQRRQSGFLSPFWGRTQRSGFYFSAPFYWNLAPNLDTTITPSYYAERGEMLSDQTRYLTHNSKGSLNLNFMPNDQKLHKERYYFSFKDKSAITPQINSLIDLNLVSDHTYFNDLNTALGVQRSSYLNSIANINYGGNDFAASTAIQHYQSIDPTIGANSHNIPYDVLPRINLSYNHLFDSGDLPLRVGMLTQYGSFNHKTLVNGQRMVFWPSVSMPFESTAGFFIPKASVQSVQYELTNQNVAGLPSSINRTLPIFSVDSGLSFEKPMEFGDGRYNHIIEPRLFYLYIPRKNQYDIPLFDTTAYDPSFNSLFRENSYTGYDRLIDANQVTVAATSRFVDSHTGLEPLKVSVGEIFYFQNRDVTLNSVYLNQISSGYNIPVQTGKNSNLVSEVSGQIDEHLSYLTGAQWNSEENRFARGQAVLKYRNQPDQIFDIGYRYRSSVANPLAPQTLIPGSNLPANISLADASFRWPLFNDWFVLGRWQYSLNFDKTLESFIGLEKENCCWRLRFIGRRFINGATTSNYTSLTPENSFFVQIELKGLSGLGDNVDQFLQNSLNGYHKSGYFD